MWENRHHFLTVCTWDALNVNANGTKVFVRNTKRCSNHESLPEQLKSYLVGRIRTRKPSLGFSTWKVMRRKCVERYRELANKTVEHLHQVSTPCLDDHHLKEEEFEMVGGISKVCSQSVLKCLHLARIGRADIQRSVKKTGTSSHKMDKSL